MSATHIENESCLIYVYYTFAEKYNRALGWGKTFMFQLKTWKLPALFLGSTFSVDLIAQRDHLQLSILYFPKINRCCWKLK